jgi:hypothetical protein
MNQSVLLTEQKLVLLYGQRIKLTLHLQFCQKMFILSNFVDDGCLIFNRHI